MSCINTLIEAMSCIHENINPKDLSLSSGTTGNHCSVNCLVAYFRAPQLCGVECTAEQTSAAEIPCDSHHGITELFGAATFDLKPLSHTQNAPLACASRGDATLQHEKAAEGE